MGLVSGETEGWLVEDAFGVLTQTLLCVRQQGAETRCLFSSCKDTSPVGLGPTLMTPSNRKCLHEDPVGSEISTYTFGVGRIRM